MKDKIEKYKIIISPEAAQSISEHVYFLATVNQNAAEKLKNDFLEIIGSLDTFPNRCPVFDTYEHDTVYRSIFCNKRYRILFTIEESFVYVDDVKDCRSEN